MEFITDDKFDNILLDILQNVNTLPNFLNVIFGFLRRRTDMFYMLTETQTKMGFLPGVAENMVLAAFKNHKEIFESSAGIKCESSAGRSKKVEKQTNKEATIQTRKPEIKPKLEDVDGSHVYFADAECYNGAIRDKYSWSQTIGEVEIRVKIPSNVSTSKDVNVVIDKKHLKVSHRISKYSDQADDVNNQTTTTAIVDGDLCWEVKKHDVFWSFDPKDNVVLITMEKVQERWWDAFFVGEELINTRKIDCSRPMSDLDDEAQAKIHKLMYDNQQKQLGLPTSDQQQMNAILKKAWNMEGSPFKGTEFDPSAVDTIENNSGGLS